MRKISKAIGIALSLVIVAETAGFDTSAADAGASAEESIQGQEGQTGQEKPEGIDDAGQEDASQPSEMTTGEADEDLEADTAASGEVLQGNASGNTSGNASGNISGNVTEEDAAPVETMETPVITEFTVKQDGDKVKATWKSTATGNPIRKIYVDGSVWETESVTMTGEGSPSAWEAVFSLPSDLQKYRVKVVESDGSASWESGEESFILDLKTPGDVSGFTATPGHDQVILSWESAADATDYYVWRGSQQIYSGSATGYTDSVKSGSYTYTIQAYRKRTVDGKLETKKSAVSSVSITYSDSCGSTVKMMTFSGRLKSNAPYFKKATAKKKAGTLSKGTKITTLDFANKRFLCKLTSGKQVWISKDRMSFSSQKYVKKDYTTHVKNSYVNANGYKSSSNYLVWTSLYTQRINIFQGSKGNWKLIRSGKCASGKAKTFTPMGTFKIGKKEKGWFYRSYYVKPVVHFSGANAFHSRLYRTGSNGKRLYDSSMGKPASHGCIRLMDTEIQFLYQVVPKGSTVVNL